MGKRFATLNDLAKAFAETPDRFVIKMIGDGPPLVLDPQRGRKRAGANQDALQRDLRSKTSKSNRCRRRRLQAIMENRHS